MTVVAHNFQGYDGYFIVDEQHRIVEKRSQIVAGCKVRGISLNSKGTRQLNYAVLRQNVLDDIQQPLESGVRQTNVVKPYDIVRDAKQYAIETVLQTT